MKVLFLLTTKVYSGEELIQTEEVLFLDRETAVDTMNKLKDANDGKVPYNIHYEVRGIAMFESVEEIQFSTKNYNQETEETKADVTINESDIEQAQNEIAATQQAQKQKLKNNNQQKKKRATRKKKAVVE